MQIFVSEITSLKFSRLVIIVIITFFFADLLPHPLLSHGIIVRTSSKVQKTFVRVADL